MSITESDAQPLGDVIERAAGGTGALSALEAARSLADTRYKEQAQANKPKAETPEAAPKEAAPEEPEKESAGEADAAPPEEATGETEEATDQADEQPPLDRPRPWSKERQDAWTKLDRATQEYLLEHDREASTAVRKAQNEAAERAKAIEAKEQAAEQVRKQYEDALPMLLQALQEQQQGEFADIKSMADVEKMAREDWPRYVQWDAQQKKIAAVQQQVQVSQTRQNQEKSAKWNTFANEQDALFLEKAPELKDKDAMTKATKGAVEMLKDLGFKDDELGQLWNSSELFRDHRFQLLIRDGVKFREARAAAKKVTSVPKPPVQRPGAAPQRGASTDAQIQALTKQLEKASGLNAVRIGQQIRMLQTQGAAAR